MLTCYRYSALQARQNRNIRHLDMVEWEPISIDALRARIEQNPTHVSAYLQLAQIYRRADRFEQAREVLQEGLGPTGNNFELMIELTRTDLTFFAQRCFETLHPGTEYIHGWHIDALAFQLERPRAAFRGTDHPCRAAWIGLSGSVVSPASVR